MQMMYEIASISICLKRIQAFERADQQTMEIVYRNSPYFITNSTTTDFVIIHACDKHFPVKR